MPQYTINSKYASIIAMDTHARTTTARGISLETAEVKARCFNDCPSPEEIASWIQKSFPAPHYAAYESGCTGFFLCRRLVGLGIDCEVIAVSSIARSTDDRQHKNDHRDAKALLNDLLTPGKEASAVWLPDEGCEGMRDLLRAYRDATDALKRSKQQLSALLLRHGHVWNEKAPSGKLRKTWGGAHMKWLGSVELGSAAASESLEFYRAAVAADAERAARLMARIEGHAKEARWKPYADALCCIKGVGLYAAMVYACEIGDFSRFRNGQSVSRWTGLTPKSHASGERQQANGHITKAGNAHVRAALVEGMSSASRRSPGMGRLKPGQEAPEHIIAECDRCNHRIHRRYWHLRNELKKEPNVAKVAMANELIRWIWAIGCMVQEGQRAKEGIRG